MPPINAGAGVNFNLNNAQQFVDAVGAINQRALTPAKATPILLSASPYEIESWKESMLGCITQNSWTLADLKRQCETAFGGQAVLLQWLRSPEVQQLPTLDAFWAAMALRFYPGDLATRTHHDVVNRKQGIIRDVRGALQWEEIDSYGSAITCLYRRLLAGYPMDNQPLVQTFLQNMARPYRARTTALRDMHGNYPANLTVQDLVRFLKTDEQDIQLMSPPTERDCRDLEPVVYGAVMTSTMTAHHRLTPQDARRTPVPAHTTVNMAAMEPRVSFAEEDEPIYVGTTKRKQASESTTSDPPAKQAAVDTMAIMQVLTQQNERLADTLASAISSNNNNNHNRSSGWQGRGGGRSNGWQGRGGGRGKAR